MATANKILQNSQIELGVNNTLTPLEGELQQASFDALVDMLNEWAEVNIALGITIPTNPADELGNPAGTDTALSTQLALYTASIFRIDPSRTLKQKAKKSWRRLKDAYGLWPVQTMPNSLPLGQGNKGGPRTRRFFPNDDQLGINSDAGLGV